MNSQSGSSATTARPTVRSHVTPSPGETYLGDGVSSKYLPPKFNSFELMLEQIINDPNFAVTSIALAIALVIFTFVLIRLCSSKGRKGDSILLIGLAESGKTTLATLLSGDVQNAPLTVTSMKANEIVARISKSRSCSIIDLPGFDRLRPRFWEEYRTRARALIFVIDSLAFLANSRDVADFLYDVFSDPFVSSSKIPVLVACNKQDSARAKSCSIISRQLEKEMTAIRETRASSLNQDEIVILGSLNKDFTWRDVKNPISFCDCSCLQNEPQVRSVAEWILTL